MLGFQLPVRRGIPLVRNRSRRIWPERLTDYVERSNMDEDVREQIQIVLVHGSWKKEDQNRINIDVWRSSVKGVLALAH